AVVGPTLITLLRTLLTTLPEVDERYEEVGAPRERSQSDLATGPGGRLQRHNGEASVAAASIALPRRAAPVRATPRSSRTTSPRTTRHQQSSTRAGSRASSGGDAPASLRPRPLVVDSRTTRLARQSTSPSRIAPGGASTATTTASSRT